MMPFRTPDSPGAHPAPQVVELSGGDALSPHGRRLAWALTLVLLFSGLILLSASAATQLTGARPVTTADGRTGAGMPGSGPAAGADGATPAASAGTTPDGAIQAYWDGPTTHLDWTGATYTTAEATFVGDRVASPGDRVHRTLRIGNAGPSDALMTVSLVLDRSTGTEPAPGDLAEAIQLFWDVAGVQGDERFSTLLATGQEPPVVAQVRVPQGETVPVTVGFSMPTEVTGYTAAESASVLDFHVHMRLHGDTAAPGVVAPDVPDLAVTGGRILGLLALALGLAGLGWLLTLARRRRRCDDCGTRRTRGDRWTEQHAEDGTRTGRCAPCQAVAEHGTGPSVGAVPGPR